MQLLRSSVPVVLSVFVLLSTFSNASPLHSLSPRQDVCAADYITCKSGTPDSYCCPPDTSCAPDNGCGPAPSKSVPQSPATTSNPPPLPKLPLPPLPDTATAPDTPPQSQNKGSPISTTTLIIIASTGGGIALILVIVGSWACHRKRQEGRLLLAAYESPDRTPYEAISLKTKRSTASFRSGAPSTPTNTAFNVPQHAATPPPLYLGDEKQPLPRFPPAAAQPEMSPSPSRAVFPVEVLGSPRTSSLPPYSPQRTAFVPQERKILEVQTALSPVQKTFPQQAQPVFSPVQGAFPPSTPMQSSFSFGTPQTSSTPVHSPPVSPHTPRMQQDMFLPVDGPVQQRTEGYPMAY